VSGSSTFGAILTGQGSTFDIVIENKSGAGICSVLTGTTIWSCSGLQTQGIMIATAFQSLTPAPTGNTGTCGGTITVTGGGTVGNWTSTTGCTVGQTIQLTGMPAVSNGYVCDATDIAAGASGVVLQQTSGGTTSVQFTVRSAGTSANDNIRFKCLGY
jgi:hypothetical protein